jgi:hypothetical protein
VFGAFDWRLGNHGTDYRERAAGNLGRVSASPDLAAAAPAVPAVPAVRVVELVTAVMIPVGILVLGSIRWRWSGAPLLVLALVLIASLAALIALGVRGFHRGAID